MRNLFCKHDLELNDEFVSVSTLSKTLSLSSRTIYRLIQKEKLKSIKVNGYHLVQLSSLENIIEEV
ncbi:MAG: helix-turn-helix domain-containing protein [Cetobacterium sp.]|uniref:helix-turn-helix domain-containing protein n=1 Tax=Cetobacterium sp. TaxID=2071632 RepID=UPI003EE78452